MSQITLVRHGQANSQARDEQSYDKLSELGHQQARWLGEHFDASGERFARVYSGTLRRHRETAAGIGTERHAELVLDERLNEIRYFDLAHLALEQHGLAIPQGREEFARHSVRMIGMWRDGQLEDTPESYDHFMTRIREAIDEIAAGKGRALVVTSGGWIGVALAQLMELGPQQMSLMMMSVMNTSVTRLQPLNGQLMLAQFNALPHLETVQRQFARTHI
ncbi:histidine phosphatase family protein [Mesobacterium pallidum]|uniref:histidine phosphatase family protein n=1 Tax=Mesobacterium pallidum TaxID=2872037 RepID=UPI001EE33091|nr:histidine phosphatase family protein [Mesobacterium pallidum]